MQNTEQDKSVVQLFFEVWNGRRLDIIKDVFATPYSITNLLTPDKPPKVYDHKGIEDHVQKWLHGFPDFYLNVKDILTQDNRIMVRWISEGTHMQTFEGIEPTRKLVRFSTIGIFEVKDGRLIGHSALVDAYSLYFQLGLIK